MIPSREPVFLDTAFLYARINTRDQWHAAALLWEQKIAAEKRRLMTTEFILLETADGLADVATRPITVQLIEALQMSSSTEIILAFSHLLQRGLELYRRRQDKNWGLTDCISFVVMNDYGLTEALTSDAHFQQAGFRALLLEAPN